MSILNERNYRHELKFLLDLKYAEILKYRLSLLMEKDAYSYTPDGEYYIRSLYFDDAYDTAYYEKVEGLEKREKYRIRYYNHKSSYIVLELKGKNGDFTYKRQNKINKREYNYIICQNYDKIKIGDRDVLRDFIMTAKQKNLRPDIIVDYVRVAYVYPLSDIRITFDSSICSGRFNYDLFDKNINLFKVIDDNKVILEVKYNDIFPKILIDIIKTVPSVRIAMSKFALCKEKKVV